MKKTIKWVLVIGAGLIFLIIIALIVLPRFVNTQQYRTLIEKQVSAATGRPFLLGGDLGLSLFPHAEVSFYDLHVGNPDGFEERDFVCIRSFEARVKLLPLLFKDIQIKRFIIDGARIVLEKGKDGRTSWAGLGKSTRMQDKRAKLSMGKQAEGFPVSDLTLDEFVITNGSVLWIDHTTGEHRNISNATVHLRDVSMNNPIKFSTSFLMDGKPVSLDGSIGPLGKNPGKASVPLNLSARAFRQLNIKINGSIANMTTQPSFDLALQVAPFSPRKLISALDRPFPLELRDPQAAVRASLKAGLKGDRKMVTLSDGVIDFDDSKLGFSACIRDFLKPDVTFDLTMNTIDADRYLPPPKDNKGGKEAKAQPDCPAKRKADYSTLRKVRVNGSIKIGKLKIKDARMQDLDIKVSGEKGIFIIKPINLNLYKGAVAAEGSLNITQNIPHTEVKLKAHGIQANPLLKDVLKKDIIDGVVLSQLELTAKGVDAAGVKRTLNGKGELIFKDGAIRGLDLVGMVRNVKEAFGHSEETQKRHTEFTELRVPFTVTNGVVSTTGTSLESPLIRIIATGKANLAAETLDFRVVPEGVTTSGMGDADKLSGIMVPVRVTGTFSSPKFTPDVKSLIEKGLERALPGFSEVEGIKGLMKDVFNR